MQQIKKELEHSLRSVALPLDVPWLIEPQSDNFCHARTSPLTRQQILNCAANLFAKQGYRGAPIRDVARALGYSKSAIYSFFSSKDEILFGILDELLSAWLTMIAAPQRCQQTPSETLHTFIVDTLTYATRKPAFSLILLRDAHYLSSSNRAAILTKKYEMRKFVERLLTRMRPDVSPQISYEILTDIIIGSICLHAAQSNDSDANSPRKFANMTASIVVQGLLKIGFGTSRLKLRKIRKGRSQTRQNSARPSSSAKAPI